MPKDAINVLNHHSKQVTLLEWCPHKEFYLASGSDDQKVFIWDHGQAGQEQTRQNYEDGPPELLFPHMYHSSMLEDIQWNPNAGDLELSIASIETQKSFQIWQMKDDFIED